MFGFSSQKRKVYEWNYYAAFQLSSQYSEPSSNTLSTQVKLGCPSWMLLTRIFCDDQSWRFYLHNQTLCFPIPNKISKDGRDVICWELFEYTHCSFYQFRNWGCYILVCQFLYWITKAEVLSFEVQRPWMVDTTFWHYCQMILAKNFWIILGNGWHSIVMLHKNMHNVLKS